MTVVLLLACQEPFDRDRHDLEGARIAAMSVHTTAQTVQPRVALVQGGHLYGDRRAVIEWFWVDRAGDSATWDGEPIATGPSPTLSRDGERLAVRVQLGEETLLAERDVGATASTLALDVGVLPIDLTLEGADLALESRRRLEPTPARGAPEGSFLRFSLAGMAPSSTARFTASPGGTFFELDRRTADWAPGGLIVDDDEIVERSQAPSGLYSALALEAGEEGSGFAVADFFVGPEPRGAWVHGRFLVTEEPLSGRVWALLDADEEAPTGLGLRDAFAANPGDTWDASQLNCVDIEGGSFDPNWLVDGRCARNDVLGTRVLVELEP